MVLGSGTGYPLGLESDSHRSPWHRDGKRGRFTKLKEMEREAGSPSSQKWKERQVHQAQRDGKRGRFTKLTEVEREAGSPSSQRWKERQVHRAHRDGKRGRFTELTEMEREAGSKGSQRGRRRELFREDRSTWLLVCNYSFIFVNVVRTFAATTTITMKV